ncbi:hypothetical protein K0U07_00635 [bacterium]|nr:hypothetical protein [bacterium]
MKIFRTNWLWLFLLFGAVSCATRSAKVITMKSYLQVENGETREQVLQQFGEPFSIEMNDSGVEVFTYIERFFMNGEVYDSRYYYFYIKDGKVIGKVATSEPAPLQINSDDL